MEMILASKSGKRRWYLAISFGSNVPVRSRGIESCIFDVPVSTVFFECPLRRLGGASASRSSSRCSSNSVFRMRSESAVFRSSNRPSLENTSFGSRPASSRASSSFSIAI